MPCENFCPNYQYIKSLNARRKPIFACVHLNPSNRKVKRGIEISLKLYLNWSRSLIYSVNPNTISTLIWKMYECFISWKWSAIAQRRLSQRRQGWLDDFSIAMLCHIILSRFYHPGQVIKICMFMEIQTYMRSIFITFLPYVILVLKMERTISLMTGTWAWKDIFLVIHHVSITFFHGHI